MRICTSRLRNSRPRFVLGNISLMNAMRGSSHLRTKTLPDLPNTAIVKVVCVKLVDYIKHLISFPLPELTRTDLFLGVQNLGFQFGIGLPESSITNWSSTATNPEN